MVANLLIDNPLFLRSVLICCTSMSVKLVRVTTFVKGYSNFNKGLSLS